MIIQSNFKDYYDKAMGLDLDRSLTYRRFSVIEEVKSLPFQCGPWNYIFTTPDLVRPHMDVAVIGFCGKIYPCIRMVHDTWTNRKCCYSIGDVDAWVQQHYPKHFSSYKQEQWG